MPQKLAGSNLNAFHMFHTETLDSFHKRCSFFVLGVLIVGKNLAFLEIWRCSKGQIFVCAAEGDVEE